MDIEKIQKEMQEEINLCSRYIGEENFSKLSTDHERLALKIINSGRTPRP